MDTTKVLSLLEQLDEEIDDLEESLSPLISNALSETASKLPLLDKAKLYVLVTYAIESMLFSYLRLHGVKAREHPVFTELSRVKQYFEKIKRAENPVGKRENLSVDKAAAARIIKAGLSGNDKYDLVKAELQAKERAKAHIKFGQRSEQIKQDQLSKKRKVDSHSDTSDSNSDSDSDSAEAPAKRKGNLPTPAVSTKAQKVATPVGQDNTAEKHETPSTSDQSSSGKSKKNNKNKHNKQKKRQKQEAKVQ